jgi:hypothetical protein
VGDGRDRRGIEPRAFEREGVNTWGEVVHGAKRWVPVDGLPRARAPATVRVAEEPYRETLALGEMLAAPSTVEPSQRP